MTELEAANDNTPAASSDTQTEAEPTTENAQSPSGQTEAVAKQSVDAGVDRGPPPPPANDNVAQDVRARTVEDVQPPAEDPMSARSRGMVAPEAAQQQTLESRPVTGVSDHPLPQSSDAPPPPPSNDKPSQSPEPANKPLDSEQERSRFVEVDRATVVRMLRETGMERGDAEDYAASFSGQIWVGELQPGDEFLRYANYDAPTGKFLTTSVFQDSTTAKNDQYLIPRTKDGQVWDNNATHVQVVTVSKPTIVFQGRVMLGASDQTLVTNKADLSYGPLVPLERPS